MFKPVAALRAARAHRTPFITDRRGGVIVLAALLLPMLLMLVGGTINLGLLMLMDTKLQAATDAAAIAIAKELQLSNDMPDETRMIEVAKAVILQKLGISESEVTLRAWGEDRAAEIVIEAQQHVHGFILGSMLTPTDTLTASAAAQVIGKVPVCVIGLDESSQGTLRLEKEARMTGNNCAVYSNSSHPNGIKSKDSALLHAALICSAGGADGGKGNFDPIPLTDCPVLEDPLADRPAPQVGECMPHGGGAGGGEGESGKKSKSGGSCGGAFSVDSGEHTLEPGTYCGGIHVGGTARVNLNPGLYVIKDGPLEVTEQGELSGEYTSFYLTGAGAVFTFSTETTVSLGAMADGTLAGLLFFEDRSNPLGQSSEIYSNNTRNLLGTIYLSRGRIFIGADAPIADESAYTAIVVQKLELEAGPHLVLNTNYEATDVPVPEGIYGSGSQILLTR